MDSRVGPAAPRDAGAHTGDPLHRILQDLLHGTGVSLDLPAVIAGPIILQCQQEPGHGMPHFSLFGDKMWDKPPLPGNEPRPQP